MSTCCKDILFTKERDLRRELRAEVPPLLKQQMETLLIRNSNTVIVQSAPRGASVYFKDHLRPYLQM